MTSEFLLYWELVCAARAEMLSVQNKVIDAKRALKCGASLAAQCASAFSLSVSQQCERSIQNQNKTIRVFELEVFFDEKILRKMDDDLFAAFETEEPAKILKQEKNGDAENTE